MLDVVRCSLIDQGVTSAAQEVSIVIAWPVWVWEKGGSMCKVFLIRIWYEVMNNEMIRVAIIFRAPTRPLVVRLREEQEEVITFVSSRSNVGLCCEEVLMLRERLLADVWGSSGWLLGGRLIGIPLGSHPHHSSYLNPVWFVPRATACTPSIL